jgi:hypothetical protein
LHRCDLAAPALRGQAFAAEQQPASRIRYQVHRLNAGWQRNGLKLDPAGFTPLGDEGQPPGRIITPGAHAGNPGQLLLGWGGPLNPGKALPSPGHNWHQISRADVWARLPMAIWPQLMHRRKTLPAPTGLQPTLKAWPWQRLNGKQFAS